MTTMLTASQIFVMDLESYETLMILRQQMLDAGATNAIVEDLTSERQAELRRNLYFYAACDEQFDENWTIWDEIDISPSDWWSGNF